MALRTAKGQVKNGTGGTAEALLTLLQGADPTGLTHQLKQYVAPLNGVAGHGKENSSKTELHKFAKQYVPFLVQLLKLCAALLATPPSGKEKDGAMQTKGDESFAAMSIALDSLDHLRSFLVGCPFEIEIQRCGLVRRLRAWKRHADALEQCQINFRSLCYNVLSCERESIKQGPTAAPVKGGSRRKQAVSSRNTKRATDEITEQHPALHPPQQVELASGLPSLVAGIVIDLIWCTAENGSRSPDCFCTLVVLPDQLDPWLRVLETGAAEKQRDALFRGIHKCASILVATPASYDRELVQQFCMLSLCCCASSSHSNQYAKVARNFSSCLSCHGPDMSLLALDVCTAALTNISQQQELQGLCGNHDMLDLVDWYARLCQTTGKSLQGWSHVCNLVGNLRQVSPSSIIALAGLHAVGLSLVDEDVNKDGKHDIVSHPKVDFFSKAHDLLQAGAETVESWLQQEVIPNDPVGEMRGRHLLSAFKAVDFLRRHAAKYVQSIWGISLISRSCLETPEGAAELALSFNFNGALEKVLHLGFLVVKSATRCKDWIHDEQETLKKGWHMASDCMLAAFRLSLVRQQGVEEIVAAFNDLVSRSCLQAEELRWLMSSTYNMGVHIFNAKHYDMACHPFSVAYTIAWARISSLHGKHLSNTVVTRHNLESYALVSELVSEACAKSVTLADALNRGGKSAAALETLSNGIVQWAMVNASLEPHSLKAPHSLVRLWVKMMHAEKEMASKPVTSQPPCLYAYLRDDLRHLHPRTLGVLLEEELSVLEVMDTSQNLSMFRSLKEHQLHILLDNIYIGDSFPVERSRLLLEKSRHTALEESQRTTGDMFLIACLANQLGATSCVRALCAYELDPYTQEYIEDIVAGFKLWRTSLEAQKTFTGLEAQGNARSEYQVEWLGEASLGLLLNVFDLLSLKGYSGLQYEAQELIFDMAATVQVCSGQELCAALWANKRLGHVLCLVPVPTNFCSLVSQKLGVPANSLEFWQNCAKHCPSSLLDAQQREICHDLLDQSCNNRNTCNIPPHVSEGYDELEEMALSQIPIGRQGTRGPLVLAGLYYMLAERASDRGHIREALKYAKEGFRLRSRVFNRTFQMPGKVSSCSNIKTSQSSLSGYDAEKQKTVGLEVSGQAATLTWPGLTTSGGNLEFGPSQWCVLGDYIESLMQVGVINEKMGAVDDAERSFREGKCLTLAQHMPLAHAAFSSCLGEVHRKRHQWELAESDLMQAKQLLGELDCALVCNHCNIAGHALLDLRLGDLARRRSDDRKLLQCEVHQYDDESGSSVKASPISASDALSCYQSAKETLLELLARIGVTCECTLRLFTSKAEVQLPGVLENNAYVSSSAAPRKKAPARKKLPEVLQYIGDNCLARVEGASLQRMVKTESCISSQSTVSASREQNLDGKMREALISTDLQVPLPEMKEKQNKSQPCTEERPVRRQGLRSQKLYEASEATEMVTVEEKQPLRRRKPKAQQAVEVKTDNFSGPPTKGVDRVQVGGISTRRRINLDNLEDTAAVCEAEKNNKAEKLLERKEESMAWTCHLWAKYGHQLLARVLTQAGKYHMEFGDYAAADEMYQQAMCVLGVRLESSPTTLWCDEQPRHPACTPEETIRDQYPIEEAALLYHMSRLHMHRKRHIRTNDSNVGAVLPLAWLYHAFSLSTQLPPLLSKVARLLSILHVSPSGCPSLHPRDKESGSNEQAAFFHQVSLGAGIRQQHLSILDSKMAALLSETDQGPDSSIIQACIKDMQQALCVLPQDNNLVGNHIRVSMKGIPCSTVCCISLVDREHACLLERTALADAVDGDVASAWLLITRLEDNSRPMTLLLPMAPLVDFEDTWEHGARCSQEGSPSCPYSLNDHEDQKSGVKLVAEVDSPNPTLNGTCLQTVVSEFGAIMEESRQSTSRDLHITTNEEKSQWWRWRMQLDARLASLLRTMEESWLGPWKCILLGEPTSTTVMEAFQHNAKELCNMLRQEDVVGTTIDENLLRLLLQGVGTLSTDELEAGISRMLGFTETLSTAQWPLFHGFRAHSTAECHCTDKNPAKGDKVARQQLISEAAKAFTVAYKASARADRSDSRVGVKDIRRGRKQTRFTVSKEATLETASTKSGETESVDTVTVERQAVMLILDANLQTLPWESLPVLRRYEMYRMPSVGSIHALAIHQQYAASSSNLESQSQLSSLGDSQHPSQQEGSIAQFGTQQGLVMPREVAEMACVDPHNTFYLLNPSGDLGTTQEAFEDWFKQQQGWEGKTGEVPTVEEYVKGLQNHDLFLYLGHGSGDQYLSEKYIRRLDRCAAALLMGCSSGRLSPRGDYEPVGVPLSYLMAGCPGAVANLWDVTDGDIDRFSRLLLHKWLDSTNLNQAVLGNEHTLPLTSADPEEEMEMSRKEYREAAGSRHGRKNENYERKVKNESRRAEGHLSKMGGVVQSMGSSIGEARDACRLPHLIGASPVYYGVPTSITRKGGIQGI